MTANPTTFQLLIVGSNDNHITELHINDGFKIGVSSEETLLGIQIDEQLKLDWHIDKVCKKAAIELNAIKRLAWFTGSKERVIKSISFLGPKIWNFLPNEIKSSKDANLFKVPLKDWYFENQCA